MFWYRDIVNNFWGSIAIVLRGERCRVSHRLKVVHGFNAIKLDKMF